MANSIAFSSMIMNNWTGLGLITNNTVSGSVVMANNITANSLMKNSLKGFSQMYLQDCSLFDVGSRRLTEGFAKSLSISNMYLDCSGVIEQSFIKPDKVYRQKLLMLGVESPSDKIAFANCQSVVNSNGNEITKHDITGFLKRYNKKVLLVTIASCRRSEGFARCCFVSNVNADISDNLPSQKEEVIADEPNFLSKTSKQASTVSEASGEEAFSSKALEVDNGGVGSGNGNHIGYGGNDDNGSGKGDDAGAEDESHGLIMNSDEVSREAIARGITLPPDLAEAARTVGIEKLLLFRYFDLQGALWPLGSAIRNNPLFRNWMLADPSFLFKLLVEVAIDATCATIAEVQKRGKDFWSEFELYASDLVVGVVLDISLVCMLAPYVRLGGHPSSHGAMGRVSKILGALPSSVFEAERPGRHFTLYQRVGTLFVKGAQYGVVGFMCGLVGQGFASTIMKFKRKLQKSDKHQVAIPPVLPSAALWGLFMAVSSNTRYQIVNGLERVVESSLLAKQIPQFAMAFTIGIRFANNIYGGMQFVDWARWAGVQ